MRVRIVSAFPVDFNSATLKAYKRTHGGQDEAFGLPSYTAAARQREGDHEGLQERDGDARRGAEERPNTKLTKKESLLGFPVKFLKKNTGAQLGAPATWPSRPTSRSSRSAPTGTTTAWDEVEAK